MAAWLRSAGKQVDQPNNKFVYRKPMNTSPSSRASRNERAAGASFALALIALAVGAVCITVGQWGPGLILSFAAVAGVMTAWQLRSQRSTDG